MRHIKSTNKRKEKRMKKILIISFSQYGYNTDFYKYSEYLSNEYEIYYLSRDLKRPRISEKGVNVVYTNSESLGKLNRLNFILNCIKNIHKIKPEYIIVKYFVGCSLIRFLCPGRKIVVDLRTATINNDKKIQDRRDRLISFEVNRFKNISVISEGLINKLRLNRKKAFVLPLGADRVVGELSQSERRRMDVLYIGTLDYRNIHETIEGFKEFYVHHKNEIPCRYTIIGYANKKIYEEKMYNAIRTCGLSDIVNYVGRKKYEELGPFLESHNIGVSYVPITEYFQHQPPTKTYEYVQNGLVCIATDTFENRKVINESNGILINEGAMEFYKGLEHIYRNLDNYNSRQISESAAKYSWKNIVDNILKPYIIRL